jgi:membrane-bound lytic murein transglycosylase D
MDRFARLPLAVLCLSVFVSACGSKTRAQLPSSEPRIAHEQGAIQVAPMRDPVSALIAESQRHFEKGERELKLGYLEQARRDFDRSVEVLLESSYGARSEPRIREHFDRLVDRISAYEMGALADGDGFTEKPYEAASIDQILALSTFDEEALDPGLRDAVEADLQNTLHDIPIPLNPRVLYYVELFQGRLQNFLSDGLTRGGRYLPMILSAFRSEGLPLDLAYVPLIESAFKPNALSRAKAKGVWQFMSATAREQGLRYDWYIDERSDPEKATYAAARYLKMLYSMFGDWHLALASYNGGPGRVQRAMNASGLRDFWSLSGTSKYLPRETREYVPMILAAIIVAKNPAQYGFDLTPDPPVEYEKVPVGRALDLRRIAEWTGTSLAQIQTLNPELRRWTTPVRYPDYEVKVPVGTGALLQARLRTAAPVEMNTLKWYTVKSGDTLTTVARRLQVNRSELAQANSLSVQSRLQIGQELVIPRAPAAVMAQTRRPAPASQVISTSRSAGGVARGMPAGNQSEQARLIYQVKRGDTLSSIARLFDTTVDAIKQWNKLSGSRILAGDRLTVFVPRHAAANLD